MEVKIKKFNPNAAIPIYAKDGDAGMDLTATEMELYVNKVIYKTGISIEIPKGYVGLLFPRSSITKKQLSLTNSVGVIDSGYRGEISFIFNIFGDYDSYDQIYRVGDRVGQLIIIPYPQIELKEVDELSETERGDGGFGSTGK